MMPKDFLAAVADIKLAILQARARAARVSNVEALKLYFFVGGYVSKKTRTAKWGSGAIDELSERLQIELPGLRGFSASSIKFMRLWHEAWADWFEIRYLPSSETVYTMEPIRYLSSNGLREDAVKAFVSIGFTHHREVIRFCKDTAERWYYIMACAKGMWSVEELRRHLAADDYHHVGTLVNNFEKTRRPPKGRNR